jgi:hypothetical protein
VHKRGAFETGVVLGLAYLLSTYVQDVLLEKVKTVVLGLMTDFSPKGLSKSGLIQAVFHSFGPLDWAALAGLALILVFLIVRELTRHHFTYFLDYVLSDSRRIAVFLIFLTFLFFKVLLAPGEPYFLDAPGHMSRAWYTYLNLKQGYLWPMWNNYYHNGFAMFSHYGFLYYVLVAWLNLPVGNIDLSAKLVTFAFTLGNAFVYYAWGKSLFANKRSGLITALLVTGGNIVLYEIMWVGGIYFPVVLFGFGCLVLGFEKLLSGEWKLYRAVFVASVGANIMLATHLGYSAQLLVFFAVYFVGRLALQHRDQLGNAVKFALGCLIVGGGLSAFVFLPTFLDMKDVNFYKAFPFSDPSTYKFWQVPFLHFALPKFTYNPDGFDYLGLGLIGAALYYFVAGLKKRSSWWWLGLALIALSTLIANYSRDSILMYLALMVFVTGNFTQRLLQVNARAGSFTLLIMVFLADGMIFGNFNTYNRHNGFENRFYDRLAAQPNGTKYGVAMANSLHSGDKPTNDVFVSPWLKVVGHAIMQPNAIMLEANKQALYQFAVTSDLLVPDILAKNISQTTLQGLDLIGVRYLTFHDSHEYFVPPMETGPDVSINPLGPWITFPQTRPILWAPSVVSFDQAEKVQPALSQRQAFEHDDVTHASAPFHYRPLAGSYVKALIGLMNPDLANGNAAEFVLRRGSSQTMPTTPGPATLTVQNYTVDSERVEIDFTLDKPGFVAVPFGYFSYAKVLLDGRLHTFEPTAFNTICLSVERPGEHKLVIGPSMSVARFWGALISLVSLTLFTGLFLFFEFRTRKTPRK